VIKILVRSRPDLVTNAGFQIDVDSTRNMLARRSFREECIEGIIGNSMRRIGLHCTGRVNAMFQAIELPALVSGLQKIS
jgi:hypothetical protein